MQFIGTARGGPSPFYFDEYVHLNFLLSLPRVHYGSLWLTVRLGLVHRIHLGGTCPLHCAADGRQEENPISGMLTVDDRLLAQDMKCLWLL